MRKVLTYTILIVSSLVVAVAFVTATSYTQLITASLFFPLYAYIALEIFPRKNQVYTQSPLQATNAGVETAKVEEKSVIDIDKRAFLKFVGAAGLSLFLSSIFYRKAQNTLFGNGGGTPGTVSLQDADGNKINPAQGQPTDGYRIAQIDDSIIAYYGFSSKNGLWYIMREDTENGTFRYAKGDTGLDQGWGKRESLQYDYFDSVFN